MTAVRTESSQTADPMSATATIIVVNFNGGEKLLRCLEAMLATAPASEILVVDNASTDGSANLPAAIESRVRLLRNTTNLGYAAALNQAARQSRGEVLVFCNMDTLPEPGWLEPLLDVLRDDPAAGAVNPLLMLADGHLVNAAGQIIHVTGLGFNRGLGEEPARFGVRPFEVDGIQGAVFAMRRAVYDAIGGLDETGFLYHEDVNLSWLLRLAGFRLYCVPASRVRHDYFLSMYAEKFHLLERNRVAMLLAYTTLATRFLLAPLLLLTEMLAWGYALLRRHGFVRAKWRSYVWVYQRRRSIAERRARAAVLRRVSDARLLRRFRWGFEWRQFFVLARERGRGERKPDVNLPTHE